MRTAVTRLVIVLFVAIIAGAGCGANIYTTQQEVSFGEQFAKEIEKQSNLIEDQEVNAYIDEIGQRIAKVSDRRDIDYHFKVIDNDSTVNAFAVPGGFIYLYSGLVLKAENEAEIAGVIAHEVGHVVGKHSMKRMTQLMGYQFLLAVALGDQPNQLAKLGSDFLAAGLILNYGRENEFEADSFGVRYSNAVGYDPNGFKTFLEKLNALHTGPEKSTALDKLMATHPPPADRIERVKSQIELIPVAGKDLKQARFEEIKQRLQK